VPSLSILQPLILKYKRHQEKKQICFLYCQVRATLISRAHYPPPLPAPRLQCDGCHSTEHQTSRRTRHQDNDDGPVRCHNSSCDAKVYFLQRLSLLPSLTFIVNIHTFLPSLPVLHFTAFDSMPLPPLIFKREDAPPLPIAGVVEWHG
jgi:hypothetical protein